MTSVLEHGPAEAPEAPAGSPAGEPRGLHVVIEIRHVIHILLCVVITLLVVGTAASLVKYQVAPSTEHKLAKLMNRFDLGYEPSIPNWYSSMALLATCGLLSVIAVAKWRAKAPYFKHWIVLAVTFLLLSIDEGVRLHEMIHTVIVARFETHGLLSNPWIIPAGIFVAAFGLFFLPFLRNLDRRTAVLFVCAGVIYVAGAVGMDMFGGMIIDKAGVESVYHTATQTVEEAGEMLGIVLFIYALLDYLRTSIGPVRITLVAPATAS